MTTPPAEKPPVVLLVEDEPLVRMLAADVLREEGGFKVVEANNADEALRVLEAATRVRVLVTDVEMPGSLDGFMLARLVHRAWPHIGIVVLSGRMAPGPGSLSTGALFLAKPYRPETLIAMVHDVLRNSPPSHKDAAPVLPQTIKTHQPHTRIGIAAGLAQPLPEPKE